MKYTIAVIVSSAVGGLIGLLAAWGTVEYASDETVRSVVPQFMFLAGYGAAFGLVVGVVAALIGALISRTSR